MFSSFGNLEVDPAASLLLMDFPTRRAVHLSGTATVELVRAGVSGDDGQTGCRARFRVESVVSTHTGYAHNPPITD